MQTLSYSNGPSQKPGRSIATFALVGSLHLILIYAVLAALDVVPVPPIPGVTQIRVIDKTPPTKPDNLPPIKTTMVTPTVPDHVPVPIIPIDPGTGGATITASSGSGTATVTDVFVAAAAITATHTIPAYPAIDRRLDHQGTVLLTLVIDAQGNVTGANVVQSSGFDGLDQAAVAWVKTHWRYEPATRNGTAVAGLARAEVTFRLTQN